MLRESILLLLLLGVFSALPANFSWGVGGTRNLLPPTSNQNNPHRCESGWAWATINSLSTRINIWASKSTMNLPLISLSPQVLLECDEYDFGCLGGEPSQAFSWIKNHNITDSSCNPYKARGYTNGQTCTSRSKCDYCPAKNECEGRSNAKIYALKDTGSVSGEGDMMKEIYERGPIACGMSATTQFKAYTGGLYTDKSGNYIFNHYVSVFGWGETKQGAKYWLAQNSYGPTWGEQGNFKIARGSNNLAIETLCYFGNPIDTWTADIRNKTVPNGVLSIESQVSESITLPKYLTPSTSSITPNYCDSSWAFAVTQAIADSASIKSNGVVIKFLSPQVLLNCGVGTCEKGGDPFEALSFIHKYGVPEQGCQQYQASTPIKESCSAINNCASCSGNSILKQNCTDVKNYRRWKVADYGSVSGQAQMKTQLQNHQALVCGIELSQAFKNYKGGVFSEATVAPKVNHYVQILGFGTEGSDKYWLGRAFFGSAWGLSGFFKIKMGANTLGVESKCYWAGALL